MTASAALPTLAPAKTVMGCVMPTTRDNPLIVTEKSLVVARTSIRALVHQALRQTHWAPAFLWTFVNNKIAVTSNCAWPTPRGQSVYFVHSTPLWLRKTVAALLLHPPTHGLTLAMHSRRKAYPAAIWHRLRTIRREIAATLLSNTIVDQSGHCI